MGIFSPSRPKPPERDIGSIFAEAESKATDRVIANAIAIRRDEEKYGPAAQELRKLAQLLRKCHNERTVSYTLSLTAQQWALEFPLLWKNSRPFFENGFDVPPPSIMGPNI